MSRGGLRKALFFPGSTGVLQGSMRFKLGDEPAVQDGFSAYWDHGLG